MIHIINEHFPNYTLCEERIMKGIRKIKAVKYPDHHADCAGCLIVWHEEKEEREKMEEFVIHNDETNNPTEEQLIDRFHEEQNEKAKKEEKRRPGRPAKGKGARDQVKPIRWTAEQWAEVEAAADLAGMNPSAFIRAAVLSQAREMKKPR